MPLPRQDIFIMKKVTTNTTQREYNILVVGGGINGAAIANLAAACGFSVALVEKGDFASGTSSKSTKLIHGGLRYLELGEFGLIRESLKERHIQLRQAPYLVRPLPFVIPVYRSDPRPLWMIRCGVELYDWLSGKYVIEKHRNLSADAIIETFPGIRKEGLLGGVLYFDAQMDDARLCLENVLSARSLGADVTNYVEIRKFLKENGKVIGVQAWDHINKENIEIRAQKTICCCGPWTNRVLQIEDRKASHKIRTTKGVHIVYRHRLASKALVLQTKGDKRIFFVMPYGKHTLIGTTDTDYSGDPDQVTVEDGDIDYLMGEMVRVFPHLPFHREDIVATFAGLRPLVSQPGAPSQVSRRHTIEETYGGVIYVVGGKYTTYRKIAEEVVNMVLRQRKRKPVKMEQEFPLYGKGELEQSSVAIAEAYQVDVTVVEYLRNKYGVRGMDVLQLVQKDPYLKDRICTCSPAIVAQVIYAIKTEMAYTLDDIVWRRLGIGYAACDTLRCREVIEKYLSLALKDRFC
jgi:glycerol-3-phosphate dehydrogenase